MADILRSFFIQLCVCLVVTFAFYVAFAYWLVLGQRLSTAAAVFIGSMLSAWVVGRR